MSLPSRDPDQLLTIAQLAKLVPPGAGKIRELISRNEMGHVRLGGRIYVTMAAWQAYVARNTRRPTWEEEIKDHGSHGLTSGPATTSAGPKAA